VNDIWAAVPVKEFAGAKQRLSGLLSASERQALAAAMLEDVLSVLAEAGLAGIMVNTADPHAATLAARFNARLVTARARDGHSAAVAAMAEILAEDRVAAMLTVPSDIPCVTAAELRQLCAARPPGRSFSIVPARDERGSNAILMAPPVLIPLRFGDDSFFPHLTAARQRGVEPIVVSLPGIGLDIDRPEDVHVLMSSALGMGTRAGRLMKNWVRRGNSAEGRASPQT
jgi:2-phospho-L-lactate guanylyltransferase